MLYTWRIIHHSDRRSEWCREREVGFKGKLKNTPVVLHLDRMHLCINIICNIHLCISICEYYKLRLCISAYGSDGWLRRCSSVFRSLWFFLEPDLYTHTHTHTQLRGRAGSVIPTASSFLGLSQTRIPSPTRAGGPYTGFLDISERIPMPNSNKPFNRMSKNNTMFWEAFLLRHQKSMKDRMKWLLICDYEQTYTILNK